MRIPLSNNRGSTLVAKRDTNLACQFSWYLQSGYAYAYVRGAGRNSKRIGLHNLVWSKHHGRIPRGYTVDHRNRNKLDNRLRNLRLATPLQQQLNCGWKSHHRPGVRFRVSRPNRPWEAYITINYEYQYIGSFESERSAVIAYNKAVKDRLSLNPI